MAVDIQASPHPIVLREAFRLQEAVLGLMRAAGFRERDRAGRYQLSVSQCHGLQTLVRFGPTTVNDLGARLHLEKSTASRLAESLVAKGLVRKRAPSSDRRVVILQVSEPGHRLSRRILNDLTQDYVHLLEGLEPEVRITLPAALERLAEILAATAFCPGAPAPPGARSGAETQTDRLTEEGRIAG